MKLHTVKLASLVLIGLLANQSILAQNIKTGGSVVELVGRDFREGTGENNDPPYVTTVRYFSSAKGSTPVSNFSQSEPETKKPKRKYFVER